MAERKEKKRKKRRGSGEGSIFQRDSDKRWVGKLSVGLNSDGTPKYKTVYGKKQSEVRDKLDELKGRLKTNAFLEPSHLSLGEWIEDIWLKVIKKHQIRETTYLMYESLIRNHIKPDLGVIKLAKLRPIDIQMFIDNKIQRGRQDGKEGGLSPTTIKHMLQILKGTLGEAIKQKLISENIMLEIAPPKQEKVNIKVFDSKQVQSFLSFIKEHKHYGRYYAAIFLEVFTGIRRGELLGLRWMDVDREKGVIKLTQQLVKIGPKNEIKPFLKGNNRVIYVPHEVTVVLNEHLQKRAKDYREMGFRELEINELLSVGLVFTNSKGTAFQPSNFSRSYKLALKAAGLPDNSLHSLRHFFAISSLKNGVNIKTLQSDLGHSEIQLTLDLYGDHVDDEMKEEAARKRSSFFKTNSES